MTGAVSTAERTRWRDLAEGLFDGYDGDTGVYEQFAGFHRLEPLIIAEVRPVGPSPPTCCSAPSGPTAPR